MSMVQKASVVYVYGTDQYGSRRGRTEVHFMRNGHRLEGAPRAIVALMLAVVMLASAIPAEAWAAQSVGTSASSLVRSNTKVYIKPSTTVTFFTGETYGTGSVVTIVANTV